MTKNPDVDALIRRLERAEESDHIGRLGFEAANAMKAQAAEIKNLKTTLKNIVDAWEALPGGRNYSVREVERWLIDDMKPAIDAARSRHSDTSPAVEQTASEPCGIADPSYHDCPNMKEDGGGFDGERYSCAVCGKSYYLDYEDMK